LVLTFAADVGEEIGTADPGYGVFEGFPPAGPGIFGIAVIVVVLGEVNFAVLVPKCPKQNNGLHDGERCLFTGFYYRQCARIFENNNYGRVPTRMQYQL